MTRFHDGIAIQDDARRGDLQQDPTLNGIDYLEVDTSPQGDNERVLRVHFLPDQSPAPQTKLDLLWTDILSAGVMIDISGGTRIRNVQVIERHRVGDVLVLRVDLPGDYSDYTLTIDTDRLDPYYRQVVFNFKAGCPSRFDCKASEYCPPESRPAPAIDYMAKDYGSFRQALIDLIPTLAPDWTERRAADFGISLVELLAYAGDQLSYQQDAVANESYLETARQRISVRRHARLIDYGMHDGLSATTFLQLTITGLAPVTVAGRAVIRAVALPRALQQPASRLPLELQDAALREADAVFEVILGHDQKLFLSSQLNTIPLYTWGNRQVFLPRGATSADLLGNLDLAAAPGESWRLKPGDYLLFEEVKDPQSGQPQDANPEHRQVVRLTSVRGDTDPLFNQAITHVEWANADALSFPLCVAAVNEQTQAVIDSISVARGNLAVAFHGQSIHQGYPAELPPPGVAPVVPGIDPDASTRGYRFPLEKGPLSILPGPAPDSTGTPTAPQAVHDLQRSSPRLGYPAVMD
ncbi:MAG TPA: hypothetical protein VFH83_01985, partial [Spirochaetia bacterium]|nr:hypothetical protein [Spirochaetia bacterium]